MDYYMAVVDAYNSGIHGLKRVSKKYMIEVKTSIMRVILVLTSFLSLGLTASPASADLITDTQNMTNVTNTFVIPVVNTSLSIWMTAPLIYVLATVITVILIGAVAGIIKGRRRSRG